MDTFVIRVWLPTDGLDGTELPALRGIVEHISDGSLMIFDGAEELVGFISQNATVTT